MFPVDPNLRYLIRFNFRRSTLCPGRNCPRSREIRDYEGLLVAHEPCWTCPDVRLEEAMGSPLGQLVRASFDLETALELKLQIGEDDVRADVWAGLKTVREERALWEDVQARNK